MRFLIFSLAVTLLVLSWRTNTIGRLETWLLLQGADAQQMASNLEKNLSRRLVTAQQVKRVGELEVDDGLQEWLRKNANLETPNSSMLTQNVHRAFPEYRRLTAMQKWGATEEELLSSLEAWPEIAAKEYTHLAVAIRPSRGNLGWNGCVIVGQRLPDFTPEALNEDPGRLYRSHCSLCEKPHAGKIPENARFLVLGCSRCARIYSLVAAGTDGRFRYANEFLEGFTPPKMYLIDRSRPAELLTIWQAVTASCKYTRDLGAIQYTGSSHRPREIWQTARETEMLRRGDCEDSAILLVDWLLSRGFDARVAVGRCTSTTGGGGHAWVVARLNDEEYLLEPTEGANGARRLPTVAEVGSTYFPEVLFDRDALYIRHQPTARWNGSYWTEGTWKRVEPRAGIE